MVKKMQVVRDNNKRRGREKNKKIVSCKIVNKIKNMKIKTRCRIMTALIEDYTEDLNIKHSKTGCLGCLVLKRPTVLKP